MEIFLCNFPSKTESYYYKVENAEREEKQQRKYIYYIVHYVYLGRNVH